MSQSHPTITSAKNGRSGKKFFTLAEANRALPLVKRIASDIQGVQSDRLKIHAELSASLAQSVPTKRAALQSDFDRATGRLEQLIDELTSIGVELKDPSRALLDFPSHHDGHEVLLCWKAGEETITHWHELEAGYAGRKPIDTLKE